MKLSISRSATIALFVLCSALSSFAAEKPRLTVIISIDQFPYSYLERFDKLLGKDGFRRFLDRGANFPHALYPYSTTFTGPGHAAIGTGRYPASNGIVGNDWFDRLSNRAEYCVEDPRAVPSNSSKASSFSPVNLGEDGLSDRLRESYPQSRIISISIKDRAAILMGGHRADAAYWFDPKTSKFVSSSYYHWNPAVLQFNDTLAGFYRKHTKWELTDAAPRAELEKVSFDPPSLRRYKSDKYGLGVSFPHPVNNPDAVTHSPFGSDLLELFAQHVIETEQLGKHDQPDVLFVSFSSTDYFGHYFGPDSLEAVDGVLRLDQTLSTFFAWLDARLGPSVTLALTSDHGVQSIPEVATAMGREAGRVDLMNPKDPSGTIGKFSDSRKKIDLDLARHFKIPLTEKSPASDSLIFYFEEPSLYLNWPRIARLHLDHEQVKTAVRDEVKRVRGVAAAFTNSELLTTDEPATAVEKAVRLAFRADRSGDVLVALREGFIWNYDAKGTTHGQPVEADQHVPLLFWGVGMQPGNYPMTVSPTDLATTIGALLGVSVGMPEAKPLPCLRVAQAAVAAAP